MSEKLVCDLKRTTEGKRNIPTGHLGENTYFSCAMNFKRSMLSFCINLNLKEDLKIVYNKESKSELYDGSCMIHKAYRKINN